MIGKMYRPLRISKKNRGYEFSHKYMSNLLGRGKGGIKEFSQLVTLKATPDKDGVQYEVIRIEFSGLTIPVLVDGEKYEATSKKSVSSKNPPFEIIDTKEPGILNRRMERPGIAIDIESPDHPFKEFKEAEWVYFDSEQADEKWIGDPSKGKWILRPEMSSRGNILIFEMPIYPNQAQKGADWLKVELAPVVMDGKEYLEIKTQAITQVVIVSNTEINFRE